MHTGVRVWCSFVLVEAKYQAFIMSTLNLVSDIGLEVLRSW